ncbi:MAG: pilus assembly protein [Planctomycetaceae bacterium]
MVRIRHQRPQQARRGTTIVETAVVMPVFALFLAALIEFGHAYMTIGTMQAATKSAAQIGSLDDRTTADIVARVNQVMSSAVRTGTMQVLVKNGSQFDQPGATGESIDIDTLPDVEVGSLETSELFIVEVRIPYNDVAIMPPFWARNITLTARSVMRHE